MQRSEFLVTKQSNSHLKWYRITPSRNESQELKTLQLNKVIPAWDEYENRGQKIETRVFTCVPDTTEKSLKEQKLVELILNKLNQIEQLLFGKVSKESSQSESYLYKSSLNNGMTCWRSNLITDKSISLTLNDHEQQYKIIEAPSVKIWPDKVASPSSPHPPPAPPLPSSQNLHAAKTAQKKEASGREKTKSNSITKIPNSVLLEEIICKKSQLKKVDFNDSVKVDLVSENEDADSSKSATKTSQINSIDMDKCVDEKTGQTKYSFKVKLSLNEPIKRPVGVDSKNEQITFNLYNEKSDSKSLKLGVPLVYKCQTENNSQFKNVLLKLYFNLEELIEQKSIQPRDTKLKKSTSAEVTNDSKLLQASKLYVPFEANQNDRSLLHAAQISHIEDECLDFDKTDPQPEILNLKITEFDNLIDKGQVIEYNHPNIIDNRKFTERAGSILRRVQKKELNEKASVVRLNKNVNTKKDLNELRKQKNSETGESFVNLAPYSESKSVSPRKNEQENASKNYQSAPSTSSSALDKISKSKSDASNLSQDKSIVNKDLFYESEKEMSRNKSEFKIDSAASLNSIRLSQVSFNNESDMSENEERDDNLSTSSPSLDSYSLIENSDSSERLDSDLPAGRQIRTKKATHERALYNYENNDLPKALFYRPKGSLYGSLRSNDERKQNVYYTSHDSIINSEVRQNSVGNKNNSNAKYRREDSILLDKILLNDRNEGTLDRNNGIFYVEPKKNQQKTEALQDTLYKSDQILKNADTFFENLKEKKQKLLQSSSDAKSLKLSANDRSKLKQKKSGDTSETTLRDVDQDFDNYDTKSLASLSSKKSEKPVRPAPPKTQYFIDQDLDRIDVVLENSTTAQNKTKPFSSSSSPEETLNYNRSPGVTFSSQESNSERSDSKIRKLFRSNSTKHSSNTSNLSNRSNKLKKRDRIKNLLF